MSLKEKFLQVCLPFTQDQELMESLWLEIKKSYSEKSRHYHNLAHLENMFSELDAVKDNISDFSAISFSVFYHDIIYDATSKVNEEKSAEFAELRLKKLNADQNTIEKIPSQIIATKTHQQSGDADVNYLLDVDLSILGKDWETYLEYTKQIRKEYSVYPDFLYQPGRKKVLKRFLELENIFKTEYFREKYEVKARENIFFEIERL